MHTRGSNLKIEANGITHCYDDFGSGVVPILFIHGFPLNKSTWLQQLDFLKKTNRVIAYDIRGFGDSGTDNRDLSMDLFADDLIAFMDALHIDKVIACGLSMGGYILLNAVNRFPERFKAIVLSDTQCVADSPEAQEKRYKSIQQINSGGLKDFTRNFVSAVFSKTSMVSRKNMVEEIKDIILSTSTLTITSTLKALAQRREMCPSLAKIPVPSLILCGTEDTVTPRMRSYFLVDHIPRATMQTIDNAGHLSNIEQPDEFNRHLKDFISYKLTNSSVQTYQMG